MTAVAADRLGHVARHLTEIPTGFDPHPKVAKLFEARAEMARGKRPLDWGIAELLAYGTVAWDGHAVRLVGQDVQRGTFSHRHAVLHDHRNGAPYMPLAHLREGQGKVAIFDSLLSEAAALGFEYGYSLEQPEALVIWEAQFGDFVNGAQVLIDQFLSSSEVKWNRLSGLVLLLPHGMEGQGPEHSSARLERFLELSVEDNWRVVNLTTPAQIFHALRRQVLSPFRKPLVVMSPKSLLRNPAAVSPVEELVSGRFHAVLPDAAVADPAAVRRVLLCSGKVYYDLVEGRAARRKGGRGHRARGAALPASRGRAPGRAGAVPGPGRGALGAGGAAQHGGVALHPRRAGRGGARLRRPHVGGGPLPQPEPGVGLGDAPQARPAGPRGGGAGMIRLPGGM